MGITVEEPFLSPGWRDGKDRPSLGQGNYHIVWPKATPIFLFPRRSAGPPGMRTEISGLQPDSDADDRTFRVGSPEKT
jgi:hypothetical protein